jgi:hypothetical protein
MPAHQIKPHLQNPFQKEDLFNNAPNPAVSDASPLWNNASGKSSDPLTVEGGHNEKDDTIEDKDGKHFDPILNKWVDAK